MWLLPLISVYVLSRPALYEKGLEISSVVIFRYFNWPGLNVGSARREEKTVKVVFALSIFLIRA